jgi:hypothetical protein
VLLCIDRTYSWILYIRIFRDVNKSTTILPVRCEGYRIIPKHHFFGYFLQNYLSYYRIDANRSVVYLNDKQEKQQITTAEAKVQPNDDIHEQQDKGAHEFKEIKDDENTLQTVWINII